MKRLLLLLLCALHLLSGEEEAPFSLVDQVKSPILRAAGSVSIVSGNWVDQQTHYLTTGPDPYAVAHSYISSSTEEGTLADGWDLFHPSDLEVYQPRGISYNSKSACAIPKSPAAIEKGHLPPIPSNDDSPLSDYDNSATLYYRDAGGATVVFKGSSCRPLQFEPDLKKTGYMLVNSISIPDRRDIKRIIISRRSTSDCWVVKLGDGTKRIYARSDKHKHRPRPDQKSYYKRTYHIVKEVLPSGNKREYHYTSEKELSKIITRSSDGKAVLNVAAFHRKHDQIEVHTSEGITTTFSLKKLEDKDTVQVVDKVFRPGLGKLSYSYSDKNSHYVRRVEERTSASGRPEKVAYYHDGDNKNRVHNIWTKALSGNPLTISHSFTYSRWDHHSAAEVVENDGSITNYFWDNEHRPNWVGWKDPNGNLLLGEHFIWGTYGSLFHRTLLNFVKEPILDKEFFYDDLGNVVKEILRGSFTGRRHDPLTMDDAKNVKGGEVAVWEANYSKDGRSLKTAEKDPLGNWTYYEYEPSRQLLTARFTCDQDRIIKREFFSYDEAGICIEEIVDDGSTRHKNHFTNATRRTIHRISPRRQMPFYGGPDEERWSVFTRQGGEQLLKVLRYIHDDRGRVAAKELLDANGTVQKRWTYGYDELNRLVESCDPSGFVERQSYDKAGRINVKSTPEAATTFSYDLFGRVIEERKTFPDGTSNSLCWQYDLSGRTVTQIDSRGRETTTIKDNAGRIVKKIHPSIMTESGVVRPEESFLYSGPSFNHTFPTGVTTFHTCSAAGKPLIQYTPTGVATHSYYDLKNRLVELQDGFGITTFYEYDAFDRVTKEEQVENGQTLAKITRKFQGFDLVEECYLTKMISYEYDCLGRKVFERVKDLITNQEIVTRTEYDTLHRPIKTIREDIGTVEFLTYDLADRVIEKRVLGADNSLLSIYTTSYDIAGRVIEEGIGRAGTIARTKTAYGPFGMPSSITYPDGTATQFVYNPLCRWQDGQVYFHKVITDARGVLFEELLDANDRVRMSIVRDPWKQLISSRTVIYSVAGNPVLVEDLAIRDAKVYSSQKTRFDYDTLGNCTRCVLAEGTPEAATWSYSYDVFGRKIEETKPSGITLHSSYDIKGRLSTFTSSDGSINWEYHYNTQDLPEEIINHVSGQVTRKQYTGLGHLMAETQENGLAISFGVLPSGLTSCIDYPDGSQAIYTYQYGRLKSILRNGALYQVCARDLSGIITEASLPWNTDVLKQTVDIMGRRTSIRHVAFSEERTVFDPIGCCCERTIDGNHEVFTYDYLCQLTNDNGREAKYDSLFRMLESDGKTVGHNGRNQLVSFGDQAFANDIDGRRTSDERFIYSYDALDRLVAVEGDTERAEYTYDAFNRRMTSKTFVKTDSVWEQQSSERFLWQGGCEIGSVSDDSTIKTLRILGEGLGGELGAAVMYQIDGLPYVPIHDLSGHVRVCMDTNQNVAEKLTYTAFGLESRTSNLTPWTFSSKRQDPTTGFLYFGHRFYDPSTATWLTKDPLGACAGPNLYAYVKNNPLSSVDLFGLIEESSDRGFFGSIFDSVCDFFSNAFGALGDFFSFSSSSDPVGSSIDCPSVEGSDSSKASQAANPGPKNKTYDCISLVDETEKRFFTQFANSRLTLASVSNGIMTSFKESKDFVRFVREVGREKVAVGMVLYASSRGFYLDSLRATLTALGVETDSIRTLREGVVCFLEKCRQYGIEIDWIAFGHSNGGGNNHQIFTEDFLKENKDVITTFKMVNLGSSVVEPRAINYITLGDPIPALCPTNWFNALNAEIRWVTPDTFSLSSPHSFFGSGYPSAIRDYFMRRKQGE